MEFTSPTSAAMQPPAQSSPELEHGGGINTNGNLDGTASIGMGISTTGNAVAAGSAQVPKVVQTAFIHKLYNMLEDRTIQHLISWSGTNESFVMSPSNEFSKVLAQYFKHTNISSFVRQLNMYGFHKVSDVFHTGSPDSTLWEFKHGNGSFKKGDLTGLREIKRRASRHALIHRDSFSGQKPTSSQPGTPAEPMPDTTEARLLNLEHAFYEVHSRLARTDDSYALMSSRCQALTEGLVRCHQVGHSVSWESARLTIPMAVDSVTCTFRAICDTHRKLPLHGRYA
jgi:HSF-type DNA-binding